MRRNEMTLSVTNARKCFQVVLFVFRSSLSRFAQASMAALIAMVLVGAARAATIKEFDVSGTAINVSGGSSVSCAANDLCSFSGTMMVDVTSNSHFSGVEAVDITFPGLPVFDNCCSFQLGRFISDVWETQTPSAVGTLFLDFHTTRIPASLLAFDGGSIVAFSPVNRAGSFVSSGAYKIYTVQSGSITPTGTV